MAGLQLTTTVPPAAVRYHGVVDGPVPFGGWLVAQFRRGIWVHVAREERYAVADNLRRATMWGHMLWGGRSYVVLEGFPNVPAPFLVLPCREALLWDELGFEQAAGAGGAPLYRVPAYFWNSDLRDRAGRGFTLRLIAPFEGSQAPPPSGQAAQLDPARFIFPAASRELIEAEWEASADEAGPPLADVKAALLDPLWVDAGAGDISKLGLLDKERISDRIADLDATAFSQMPANHRAYYAKVLAKAFTTQPRERAIVEIFKSAESQQALTDMINLLAPTDRAKLFSDLDYELWSLFIAVGERFPPANTDLTLDDILNLVFALWPQLEQVFKRPPGAPPTLSLNVLDEMYEQASVAIRFVASTFEGIFQLITEPEKLVEGVWQLMKLIVISELARPPISDPQARAYMDALYDMLGKKIRAAYRGAIALGAVQATMVRVKWTIALEVASWFVGVGEIRAGLTAFKATRESVEAFAAVARPAAVAAKAVDAANATKVGTKLEQTVALLNAKIKFGTDTDLMRALGYIPDDDVAKIAKATENLDLDPITKFDDLPKALRDDLLRVQKRLDAAKRVEDVVGPLSDNGRKAFKKLAQHQAFAKEKKGTRFARFLERIVKDPEGNMSAADWEAFAAAVDKLPPSAFEISPDGGSLAFLERLSRQPDACALIARPNGYAAFATLWERAEGRFDSLNALLRRMEKLIADAPPDKRDALQKELIEKLGQKDPDTLKKIDNAYKKSGKPPIPGATKSLEQLKEEALNTPPGPNFKAFRDQLDSYPHFKGSVFEVWLRKWVIKPPPGTPPRVYVYNFDNPDLPDDMLALERVSDAFTDPSTGMTVWWDGKMYGLRTDGRKSGIDLDQAFDNELFEEAGKVKVRYKKHDPAGPPPDPNVDPPAEVDFDEFGYIFRDIDAAKANREKVQTQASGEAYYLDDFGYLQHLD